MIHTNRIVTVGEQESIIDRPIVLYRGDREVEIEFTLVGNEFTFSEEGNVIKSVNASHGQLVLNTPSGEHMFSELAECHEGKVVFVVTKEMIDEFIEMGFYSFQIRLYDSAEMKSRVTIPPVMNGFDIRNPIAAEDETNVVDQGIVDYARIFKDQSNEELPTFTWDGEYVKTEWAHHDVITENKLNKIEDALYSINANIKESDVVMLNTLDQVKKDADAYVKEHMAEVEADVEVFERELNTDVQKFKVDTNAAMTTHKNEVSEELEGVNLQLAHIEKRSFIYLDNYKNFVENGDWYNAINKAINDAIENGVYTIKFSSGVYSFSKSLILQANIKLVGEACNTSILKYTGTDIAITHNNEETNGIGNSNVNYVELKNLTIEGQNITNSVGIHFATGSNLVIDNIHVKNFGKNIILGSKKEECYILFSTFNFHSEGFLESGLIIKNVQDSIFNRILVTGSSYAVDNSSSFAVSFGNHRFNEVGEPLSLVFNAPIVQYAHTGFIFDGGLGITINGGHAEGLEQLYYQTPHADTNTSLNNFIISGTVKNLGVQNGNGINHTGSRIKNIKIDKRLGQKTTLSNKTVYDIWDYAFQFNNDLSRVKNLRFIISISSDNPTSLKKIKLIQTKTYAMICEFDVLSNGTITTDWFNIVEKIGFIDDEKIYYFTLQTDDSSENIDINYIDLQAF